MAYGDNCQSPSATKDWCFTKTSKIKHSLVWTIYDFSDRQEKIGQYMESSLFPTHHKGKIKWKLRLYPKGNNDSCSDHISVYLCLAKGEKDKGVKANFRISLLNDREEQDKMLFHDQGHYFKVPTNFGYQKFLKRSDLVEGGLLPGDELRICCEVYVLMGFSDSSVPATSRPPPIRCTLSVDLWKSFENQSSSDIIIAVGSREFKAHKALLIARSPMFNAMFSHETQESQSSRVEVTDVEPDVFQELLRYMYTGRSCFTQTIGETSEANKSPDDQHSFAIELLKAATKYQLDGLKLICQHRLCNLISVESVLDVLCLADQYQADWLKDRAIQFALLNAKELTKQGAWEFLSKNAPQVLARVIARQWPAEVDDDVDDDDSDDDGDGDDDDIDDDDNGEQAI